MCVEVGFTYNLVTEYSIVSRGEVELTCMQWLPVVTNPEGTWLG